VHTRGDDLEAAAFGSSISGDALHARDDAGAEAVDVPALLEAVVHGGAAGQVVAPLLQRVVPRQGCQPELRNREN